MDTFSRPKRDVAESLWSAPEKSPSPTIQSILDGKAHITFSSESRTDSREVGGRTWLGYSYTYECKLPHATKAGEEWTTWITVWRPASFEKDRFVELPEKQVTILTGEGEMLLSQNQKVIDAVCDEISRQVSSRK